MLRINLTKYFYPTKIPSLGRPHIAKGVSFGQFVKKSLAGAMEN